MAFPPKTWSPFPVFTANYNSPLKRWGVPRWKHKSARETVGCALDWYPGRQHLATWSTPRPVQWWKTGKLSIHGRNQLTPPGDLNCLCMLDVMPAVVLRLGCDEEDICGDATRSSRNYNWQCMDQGFNNLETRLTASLQAYDTNAMTRLANNHYVTHRGLNFPPMGTHG